MECNLCTSKIELEKVICEVCGEIQDIGNLNNIKENLENDISRISGYVNRLYSYTSDPTITQLIDNAKSEAYRECLAMMNFIYDNAGWDSNDINNDSTEYIAKTRMCDINNTKVCNGCMDC